MDTCADILVVDDDSTVAEVVATYLRRAGHRVRLAADGPGAVAAVHESLPDLLVLDLMLPGFDGFEVYRRIRHLGAVPVIMLTARGEESDRILGLEMGADDYVTKPFSPRELALRVASVLRRAGQAGTGPAPAAAADVRRVGNLEVDVTGHQATRDGQPVALTSREFDLLAFLLAHPGQVFTRADLMRQVWGWEYGDQSTVTVHVRRLREKIEQDPAQPRLLATVWGVGYRLDPPPEDAATGAAPEPAGAAEQTPAEVEAAAAPAHHARLMSTSRPPTQPQQPGPPLQSRQAAQPQSQSSQPQPPQPVLQPRTHSSPSGPAGPGPGRRAPTTGTGQ